MEEGRERVKAKELSQKREREREILANSVSCSERKELQPWIGTLFEPRQRERVLQVE